MLPALKCASDRAFVQLLRLIFLYNQISLFLPIHYAGRFRISQRLKYCNYVACLIALITVPFIIQASMAMHKQAYKKNSNVFADVVAISTANDCLISIGLILFVIKQRQHLLALLSALQHCLQAVFSSTNLEHDAINRKAYISWYMVLALLLKFAYTLYELLQNVPFLLWIILDYPVPVLANLMLLLITNWSAAFTLSIFSILLIFMAILNELERRILLANGCCMKMKAAIKLNGIFRDLCKQFMGTLQLSILLALLHNLINFFANLFALLHAYADNHGLHYRYLMACGLILLQLFVLVYAGQLCQLRYVRIWDLLEQAAVADERWEEHLLFYGYGGIPYEARTLELSVFGMFSLNHRFWLYLVGYSVDFVVYILQFAMKKRKFERFHEKH